MSEPRTTVGPRLTLAIPTFNRAFYVTTAIESLRAQANTSDRWRVVVADNNSTDDTAAQLAPIATQWPRLTVLFVPEPGASIARNRALEAAGDGYVLYADDECKFPPDYIDRALDIIDGRAPKMFGGPILPWYVTPPPAWFPPDYGSYSLPWATGHSDRISLSAGNMGFEVEALRAIGGFDPARGPRGARLAFGEETAVENLMLQRFGPQSVWFDAEFVNFHAVRPEKYRLPTLIGEQVLRGVARVELARAGLIPRPGEIVPDCLKPRPRPLPEAAAAGRWQHRAVRLGLGLVRRAGVAWAGLQRHRA